MTSQINRENTPAGLIDQVSLIYIFFTNAVRLKKKDAYLSLQLTLAGLKVLMVRKGDQIIYKLPDNMSVASIGEDQRKLLMSEIQALHAATMAAAAKANTVRPTPISPATLASDNSGAFAAKTLAPKHNGFAAPLPVPLQAQTSSAEADALKETKRKLREELEQQQLRIQQQNASTYQTMNSSEVKTTRKYVKTGKYSKKRQQQHSLQHSQPQQPIQLQVQPTDASQAQQQSLSQQQLLTLQQSLQAGSSAGTQNPLPHTAPVNQPNPKPFGFVSNQLPVKPMFVKRMPEEEEQHLGVKQRFAESLASDHRAVTRPDYHTPFRSLQDAIDRLLPYHIYQYPKGDLDANKIPMDRQDNTMLDIFKCQADMFEKHAKVSQKMAKCGDSSSLQILLERQLLADQRQRLTEEQARVAAEQAAQHQEMLRAQAEHARLTSTQDTQRPPTSGSGKQR
ncbi:hypothetical protein CLU79DRAFT_779993 [Phycomyces nitens]|nr:hypothetical protein CLU79DRAFT_779993 [Phycomyces nitens]